ncbi:Peptidase M23 [Sesbania bispinosa]|nr:Peptidase M23 [Sesbania bispinosa]
MSKIFVDIGTMKKKKPLVLTGPDRFPRLQTSKNKLHNPWASGRCWGKGENGKGGDNGGREVTIGDGECDGGSRVNVEDELRLTTVVSATKVLVVACMYKVLANLDVEANHYDDNDEEDNNGN